jgi:hypothetical protein
MAIAVRPKSGELLVVTEALGDTLESADTVVSVRLRVKVN